jgi:hypothetical protein
MGDDGLPITEGPTMSDGGASFETERHRDDQPQRDDLIDPEEIDRRAEEALRDAAQDPAVEEPLTSPDVFPHPEDVPESQGDDVDDAGADDEER